MLHNSGGRTTDGQVGSHMRILLVAIIAAGGRRRKLLHAFARFRLHLTFFTDIHKT
jgi:hypothetical protein